MTRGISRDNGSLYARLAMLLLHPFANPKERPPAISRSDWYRHIALDDTACAEIVALAGQEGLECRDYAVDRHRFEEWRASCERYFPREAPDSLPADIRSIAESLRTEKLLEYFATLSLANVCADSVVADIGSAHSKFLNFVAGELGAMGWAVDPALSGCRSGDPRISFLPSVISAAVNDLPMLDAIFLHCSFEMFEPDEMVSLVRVAAEKLSVGGKLIIAPLYLEAVRAIYLDSQRQVSAARLGKGGSTYRVVHVDDYWDLDWSEWLSPTDLAGRLVASFPSLDFTLHRVTNTHDMDDRLFMKFIGVWEKRHV